MTDFESNDHNSLFPAMDHVECFQHDTAEARTKRVRVPDIDPVVARSYLTFTQDKMRMVRLLIYRQLLQYMYTGSLGEAAKGREAELLAAADKYSLLELKRQCEKVRRFHLSSS